MSTQNRNLTLTIDSVVHEFSIGHATFSGLSMRNEKLWFFDVQTVGNNAPGPFIQAGPILHNIGSEQNLPTSPIKVPFGFDLEVGRNITTIDYLDQYYDLDNNQISFSPPSGQLFPIEWVAECPDLASQYQAKTCKFQLNTVFQFEGIEEVPDRASKVLVINPYDKQRDIIQDALYYDGFLVESLVSPEEALEKLRSNAEFFDLVIGVFLLPQQCQELVERAWSPETDYAGLFYFVFTPLEFKQKKAFDYLGVEYLEVTDSFDADTLLEAARRFDAEIQDS